VTEVNGPGRRFGLWVQGCRGVPQPDGHVRHCPGCFNRHTWPTTHGRIASIESLQEEILVAVREHDIEGVSISGGEPFRQATELAELARWCHAQGISVLVFTGYTEKYLRSDVAPAGSAALLGACDLLVAGPYLVSDRREGSPLLGSRNQRLIALTETGEKLVHRVTDDAPVVEFQFFGGEVAVTGFPC
jgi:anaerobic ribonucleoside-triphosphate reductase activating protein